MGRVVPCSRSLNEPRGRSPGRRGVDRSPATCRSSSAAPAVDRAGELLAVLETRSTIPRLAAPRRWLSCRRGRAPAGSRASRCAERTRALHARARTAARRPPTARSRVKRAERCPRCLDRMPVTSYLVRTSSWRLVPAAVNVPSPATVVVALKLPAAHGPTIVALIWSLAPPEARRPITNVPTPNASPGGALTAPPPKLPTGSGAWPAAPAAHPRRARTVATSRCPLISRPYPLVTTIRGR